jgi:hypothetical protein
MWDLLTQTVCAQIGDKTLSSKGCCCLSDYAQSLAKNALWTRSVCLPRLSAEDNNSIYQCSYEIQILPIHNSRADDKYDFHEICRRIYATRVIFMKSVVEFMLQETDSSQLLIFNFLQLVKPPWRQLNFVKWEKHPPPWHHYPWSSASTYGVKTSLVRASSRERLGRYFMNFGKTLYHCKLFRNIYIHV